MPLSATKCQIHQSRYHLWSFTMRSLQTFCQAGDDKDKSAEVALRDRSGVVVQGVGGGSGEECSR